MLGLDGGTGRLRKYVSVPVITQGMSLDSPEEGGSLWPLHGGSHGFHDSPLPSVSSAMLC